MNTLRSLLSIGQFSRLAQLSVSALRFYDEGGLLTPTWVDPHSGYRYYAPEQLEIAARISALRAVELPLDEIRTLLCGDEAAAARLLAAHEQRLYNRFQRQRDALRQVAGLLRGRRELPDLDVYERAWPQQLVLSVRGAADPEDFVAFERAARDELSALLDRAGAQAAGPPFELYHAAEYLGGPLDTEVCLPVAAPLPVAGRARLGLLPAGRAACALHPGDWRTFGHIFAAVYAWLDARGLQALGPSFTRMLPAGTTELGFLLA